MKTVKTFHAGRVWIVVRSNGYVYAGDAEAPIGADMRIDTAAKLLATTPAGCTAVAEALEKAAAYLREARTA